MVIERGGGDADDIAHDLALATEPDVVGFAFELELFAPAFGRKIFEALDDLDEAGAAQAVALAIEDLVGPFVNFDIVEEGDLAEIGVLAAINFPGGV